MFIIFAQLFQFVYDNYSELNVTAKHLIATSNELFDMLRDQKYNTMHNKVRLKILSTSNRLSTKNRLSYRISYTKLKVK